MRKIFTLLLILVFGVSFSQDTTAHTLDKALAKAAPSCFVMLKPSSADSITLKFLDSTTITKCIQPCGFARRYYEKNDTTRKPFESRCYTNYLPLYVLNGTALFNSNLSGNDGARVCIKDIKQIDILKPAQAEALYGYMGRGGVILITTRCQPSVKEL